MNQEEFTKMYVNNWESTNEITQTKCGDCVYYVNGCTTSELENKYGNASTPSCSDFISKELK